MGIIFTKPSKTYPCCCLYTNDDNIMNFSNKNVTYRKRRVWVPYGR